MACNPIVSAALSAALAHWGLPSFQDPFWKGVALSGSRPVTAITDQNTGRTYPTVSAVIGEVDGRCANRGHTFLIPAGTYVQPFPAIQSFVSCTGPTPNPWLVKLQGVGGYAHLINSNAGGISKGKAALIVFHCPTVLDHIEVSGADIIMDSECFQLIITNSYIHDGQDGILTSCCQTQPSLLAVYNTRFDHNGDRSGRLGQVHNIYVGDMGGYGRYGAGTLTFVNNLSTCVYQGHQVKTRAPWNYIVGNRMLDCDNTAASIRSGTYDPATGKVSLKISQPLHMMPDDQITVVTATGTGSVSSLVGTWTETAGSSGTTANFTLMTGIPQVPRTGLTMTITGGTVRDNWGANGHILDIPNGTNAVIEDNIFRRGPDAATAIVIHHGGEVPNPAGENDMVIAGNTLISNYTGTQFDWEQGVVAAGTTVRSSINNNTFYGLPTDAILVTGGSPPPNNVPYGPPNNTFLPIAQAPALDYSTPAACQ